MRFVAVRHDDAGVLDSRLRAVGHLDVAADAADGAIAAHAHADTSGLLAGTRVHQAHVHDQAAVAALAADAARTHADGVVARGFDAAFIEHGDPAALAALTTGAADVHRQRACRVVGARAHAQHRAAGAAAATDGFGIDSMRLATVGEEGAAIGHVHGVRRRSRAAVATDAHRHRLAGIAFRIRLAVDGGRVAAGAAAATLALRVDAVRLVARGRDVGVAVDADRARDAARSAAAADAHHDLGRGRGLRLPLDTAA